MMCRYRVSMVAALGIAVGCPSWHMGEEPKVSGELKVWHCVALSFAGPEESEAGREMEDEAGSRFRLSPFRDYRMTLAFTHRASGRSCSVPGYFAADGSAAETGASKGSVWRANWMPDAEGEWQWRAAFCLGRNAAVDERVAGRPMAFDGASGTLSIGASDKAGRDFRHHGRLDHVGGRYLKFAGSGQYFLKGGADSPENFLAYFEFDGTRRQDESKKAREGEALATGLHRYAGHGRDWREGDPTWQGGKGKNIVGALRYLASQGMNSVYMLTMNVDGDGKDVWPWTGPANCFEYDCSKLDQWEVVFSQMTKLGLMLHVITQETENDQLLDGGELGVARKLYYRELIARFGHHPALVWNLGEENSNTDAQRKAFAAYFKKLDAYRHPVVIHTFPPEKERVYGALLGVAEVDGPSLQIGDQKETHAETMKWIDRSARAGRPWFVCLDEIGPADVGVKPDAEDAGHDEVRAQSLWGNLMAGGAGVEWYFGYRFAHNDLNCEDWRSRERMWEQTRIALEFFHRHLPFWQMRHADELTSAKEDYCLAEPGKVYAIYLPKGGTTALELGEKAGAYEVKWFDPRGGGALREGSVRQVKGPGRVELGYAPSEAEKDWVILVRGG